MKKNAHFDNDFVWGLMMVLFGIIVVGWAVIAMLICCWDGN